MLLRPEHLVYDPAGVPLTIIQRHYRGSHYLYELSLDDGQILKCIAELTVEREPGQPLSVRLTEKELIVFR